MSEVKYCPRCGEPIENQTQKFCMNCGYVLKKDNNTVGVVIIILICVFLSLPVLGIVAALTIPSLINRQNDVASRTKIKKAVYEYANVATIYMTETGKKNLSGAFGQNCENAYKYFRIYEGSGCNFKTADGAYWEIEPNTGYAAVSDSNINPKYSVVMWNGNGNVNDENYKPDNLKYPSAKPKKGIYTPYEFMTKFNR